ncbi:S1C family serine protease [Peterkaempfera bronchialis]|uniref:PDZ domain-containing protein n=1 Tax=Peterkaempfera bronchialis TaxID=2126346 RepID=A0A345SWK4_9ACTN|nr:trypsin-like peptidase domain-containing protein [Peterkaempfera bronchialis]AXI78109.1 PDZ domain-containing protein [Peterkaempfera bronchialis]
MDTSPRRTRSARLLPPAVAAAVAAVVALAASACTSSSPGTSAATSTRAASGVPGALPSASASAPPSDGGDQLQNDYQRVVKAVLPSVVEIETPSGLGSGIVYDDQGDIVTNAHVVGSATTFKVTLANSEKALAATLVGSYPQSDLAVIRLRTPPAGLRPATFGDSTKVQVGEIVLAMGNPLGLSSSVTQGIVSAVGRTVSEPSSGSGPGATIPNMVQTSAAINPGNSGGALADLAGRVIGINTLAAVDQDLGGGAAPGIGFAIPSSAVTLIADQLIKSGRVTNSGRAALGVTVRTVLGGPSGFQPVGAAVVAVSHGGPAAKAGIRAGDIITSLGGTTIDSADTLTQVLAAKSPGDRVKVGYTRDGGAYTAEVTLGTLGSS